MTGTNENGLNTLAQSDFKPMNEELMSSIRGGTQWPDWMIDVLEDFVEDAATYLGSLNGMLIGDRTDEELWDSVTGSLENDGHSPPTWEDLADIINP